MISTETASAAETSVGPPDDQWAIQCERLHRRFGRQNAVANLNLRVARGRTVGLVGLNGAGKTTLIRMLVGLLEPSSGTAHVAGCAVPLERDRLKPLIGYVPDRPTVYPWMRVREAIAFCRKFYPDYDDERVSRLMGALDLDGNKRVKHLSKGNAAKVSLLLAIGHDPQVLVLDEPMSGLDPLAREQFLEGVLMSGMTRDGQPRTTLFSSHSLADVRRVADEIALMHEGKLLLHSPIDELLERTKRLRAVLEDDADLARATTDPPPGTVWQQVNGREWLLTVRDFGPDRLEFLHARNRIAHLDVQDVTLEDVFKDVVRGRQNQTRREWQEVAS